METSTKGAIPASAKKFFKLMYLIGGLPFKVHFDEVTGRLEHAHSWRQIFWTILVNVSIIAIPASCLFALTLSKGIGLVQICRDFWLGIGYTNTDMIVQIALNIFASASFVKAVFTMSRVAESMSKFGNCLIDLNIMEGTRRQTLMKKLFRRALVLTFLYFLASFSFGCSFWIILKERAPELSVAYRTVTSAFFGATIFCLFLPLPPFVSLFLTAQGLMSISVMIGRYKELVLNLKYKPCPEITGTPVRRKNKSSVCPASQDNKITNGEALNYLLEKGNLLVNILEHAENSYGEMICDEIVFALLFLITGIYLGLTQIFVQGHNLAFSLLMGFQDLLLAAINCYRFTYATSHGQKIQNEVEDTIDAIRVKLCQDYDHLTEEARFKFTCLQERFREKSILRPRKAFNLNKGMAISAFGAFTTYLIVLLQFRISE